jgi:hypothetical protein
MVEIPETNAWFELTAFCRLQFLVIGQSMLSNIPQVRTAYVNLRYARNEESNDPPWTPHFNAPLHCTRQLVTSI